jgi:osmotically-inducible protein OsmY
LTSINELRHGCAKIRSFDEPLKAISVDDQTVLKMLTARFQRHPLLSAAKLGISIEDGVAVLSGYTADGAVKAVAELVTMEMPGVRAVANEIETSKDETWRYVDCRIAKKACDLLEWNSLTPRELRIRVEHGCLSIFGQVDNEERLGAVASILREFSGAKSMNNNLRIATSADDNAEFVLRAENICA